MRGCLTTSRLAYRRSIGLLAAAVLTVAAICGAQRAAAQSNAWWDTNGATAGAGSTPTGTWDLAGGQNKVWNSNSLGTTSNTLKGWANGDNAFFSAGTDAINAFTVTVSSASGAVTVNNITFEEGTPTIAGATLTLTGTTSSTSTITATSSGTISAPLAGSGINLTKAGTATLTFSGSSANTYSGVTTVNAGELDLNKTAGINAIAGNLTIGDGTGGSGADVVKLIAGNQIADSSAVTINSTGKLDLNNNAETIDGLSGVAGSLVTLGSGTLTVGANNSTANFVGVISGTGGLTKTGSGTQTLSGANTFSGATTVNAGTLKTAAANALGGTSGITVNNNGSLMLSANNTINDAATMTLNGNVITNNPATKNLVVTGSDGSSTDTSATAGLGSLTLQSRSTLDFLQSTSTIVFGQTGGVAFVDAGSFKLDIYNYIGDSTPTGNLDHLVFQQDMSSLTGDFEFWDGSTFVAATATQLGSSGFWEITPFTPVPEPSTWLAAGLSLLVIAYSQRRRFARTINVPLNSDLPIST
jgi:autotransporter-associated beta strand protein